MKLALFLGFLAFVLGLIAWRDPGSLGAAAACSMLLAVLAVLLSLIADDV